jgi:hypothetical protein
MRWTFGPFDLYLVPYHQQPPLLAVYACGRLVIMLEPMPALQTQEGPAPFTGAGPDRGSRTRLFSWP